MSRPPTESPQYTSWAFGQRLRHAGRLGSVGTVGDALVGSFFATLKTKLLDRHVWATAGSSPGRMFEWIAVLYNPVRRHSTVGMVAPADYDRRRPGEAAA